MSGRNTDSQVFSTKYSLTLPATALSYIEQVLTEVWLLVTQCREQGD